MKSITISQLTAHLKDELELVKSGEQIIVADERHHPIAMVVPFRQGDSSLQETSVQYRHKHHEPLITKDPLKGISKTGM